MSAEVSRGACPGRSAWSEESVKAYVAKARAIAFVFAWQCRDGCWHVGGVA